MRLSRKPLNIEVNLFPEAQEEKELGELPESIEQFFAMLKAAETESALEMVDLAVVVDEAVNLGLEDDIRNIVERFHTEYRGAELRIRLAMKEQRRELIGEVDPRIVHEAGHLYVAKLLGLGIKGVVLNNEGGEYAVDIGTTAERVLGSSDVEIVRVAGPIVEAVYRYQGNTNGASFHPSDSDVYHLSPRAVEACFALLRDHFDRMILLANELAGKDGEIDMATLKNLPDELVDGDRFYYGVPSKKALLGLFNHILASVKTLPTSADRRRQMLAELVAAYKNEIDDLQ